MVSRRKLHGGSVYEEWVVEGLHTKVNREVQVACRVSMIHWRRALAGFHNHEVQAPFGTDNSIPNPQNACGRLSLP